MAAGVTRAMAMWILGAAALLAWSVPPARAEPPAAVALGGELAKPQRLDAAALARLPRAEVQMTIHGTTARWQGVPLAELLRAAGAPLGEALRGGQLALYVRVRGADGYLAVYSLAELDPALRAGQVILADRRDGQPLDAKDGPFRLIAQDDKRPARSVRQVVAIDVLRAPRD